MSNFTDQRYGGLWTIFGFIGSVTFLIQTYHFLSFIWLHFVRRSSIQRYNHPDKQSWALVTGASDGIGYGFVTELTLRGFNVILHGRNKTKLEGRIKELKKLRPNQEYRTFVLDPQCDLEDMNNEIAKLVQQLKQDQIHLTVLINNLGGVGRVSPLWKKVEDRTASEINDIIQLNATFAAQITRSLLPQLKANEPSLILNMGSVAGNIATPYNITYAASKSFNFSFSRSLRAELYGEGKQGVEVLSLNLGVVQNSSITGVETGFFIPTSRKMAQAGLNVVGCKGREEVMAFWPHALQFGIVSLLPDWAFLPMIVNLTKEETKKELKYL